MTHANSLYFERRAAACLKRLGEVGPFKKLASEISDAQLNRVRLHVGEKRRKTR